MKGKPGCNETCSISPYTQGTYVPRVFSFTLLILTLAVNLPAQAEIVVIINPGNPLMSLTREQLIDIYMGRSTHFPGGRATWPIDLPDDSPVRSGYYEKLVSKSVTQINAFWARLMFSGRATPPHVLADPLSVIQQVAHNPDAIAYIDSKDVTDKVKVVYRLP